MHGWWVDVMSFDGNLLDYSMIDRRAGSAQRIPGMVHSQGVQKGFGHPLRLKFIWEKLETSKN